MEVTADIKKKVTSVLEALGSDLAKLGAAIVLLIERQQVKEQNGRAYLEEIIDRKAVPYTLTTDEFKRLLAAVPELSEQDIKDGMKKDGELPIISFLNIRPPSVALHPVAKDAADKLRIAFEAKLPKNPDDRLTKRGHVGTVEKVTQKFNSFRNISDGPLLALAQPSVYESLFLDAITKGNIPNTEVDALFQYISAHVVANNDALPKLLSTILEKISERERITILVGELDDLVSLAIAADLRLGEDTLVSDVRKLVEELLRQGKVPEFVEKYLERGEIQGVVTPSMRRSMITYLQDLKLNFEAETTGGVLKANTSEFDEYFALAYDFARRAAVASDDPIDIARTRGEGVPSNFTIRKIREKERAFVRPEAIKAGGALFTIFIEGELLMLFEIADHLILDWHRGGLDIPSGKAAAQLNRFEHMRGQRFSAEERAMIYRRIFNFGQAELLSDTLVNERFGEHFDNVMYEVTRLLDLQDRAFSDPRQISRAALFSAIESFQFNFSEFVTGSAFLKITEMGKHLEDALDLITSEDVVAHYGGTRRTVTGAIKNMGQKFLGASLPVDDLLTLAERGNDVFQFISDFNRGRVSENDFQNFLDAAKETIIARAALGGEDMASLGQPSESNESGYPRNGRNGNNRNSSDRNGYRRKEREEYDRRPVGVRKDDNDEWDR